MVGMMLAAEYSQHVKALILGDCSLYQDTIKDYGDLLQEWAVTTQNLVRSADSLQTLMAGIEAIFS